VTLNEEIAEEEKLLARAISELQAPTFVDRSSATVNLGAATEHGCHSGAEAFKRLSSIPREPRSVHSPEGGASVVDLLQTPADSLCHGSGSTGLRSQGSGSSAGSEPPQSPAVRWCAWTTSRTELHRSMQDALAEEAEPTDGLSDEERLAERLSRLGLQEVEQVGDGNCQFRAISHQLYDTPSWHVLVRRKVVAQMKQDSDYYRGFLAEEFESYAEEMSRTGTWGDELTLRAAADCLGITIHVVTSDPENWYIVYEPKERLLEKEAFLSYIAPIHFNSITKA